MRRGSRLICVREDHSGPGEAVNTLVSIPAGPAEAGHYDRWPGPRVGLRLLLDAATESGWLAARMALVAPSEHAVGRDRALGGRRDCRRNAREPQADRRRTRRIDLSARMVTRRNALLRQRSVGLLAPLSIDERSERRERSERHERSERSERRVRTAAVGVWHIDVGLRRARRGWSCRTRAAGSWHLATIDIASGALTDIAPQIMPHDWMTANETHAVLIAGSATQPDAVVRVDLAIGCRRHAAARLDAGDRRRLYLCRASRSSFRPPAARAHTRSITRRATRTSTRPPASGRRSSSSATAGRRPRPGRRSTCRSSTGRAAGSRSPTSITAAARDTAARIARR